MTIEVIILLLTYMLYLASILIIIIMGFHTCIAVYKSMRITFLEAN